MCNHSLASERISDFSSHVTLLSGGAVEVSENISVHSEGRLIKRGIYREFPTLYPHPNAFLRALQLKQKTGFELISASHNGQASKHHQQRLLNGTRLYLGDKNTRVTRGEHSYKLVYRSHHQVVTTANNQISLNWNATGHDWKFPIKQASVAIQLPPKSELVAATAATGRAGEHGQHFQINTRPDGQVVARTTQQLSPGNGLTVKIDGSQPSDYSSTAHSLIKDNPAWFAALTLFLLLPLYFLWAWWKVGRDPIKGPLVAAFTSPRGLSPAALRVITNNGYDDTAFSTAVINLAAKGCIHIHEENNAYLLTALNKNQQHASFGERILLRLIDQNNGKLVLGKQYKPSVKTATKTLELSLKREHLNAVYRDNKKYNGVGLVISAVALLLFAGHAINFSPDHLQPMLMLGLAFGATAIGMMMDSFKRFMLPAAFFFGIFCLSTEVFRTPSNITLYLPVLVFACILLLILFVFHHLLKAPTRHGQELLREIEGFKLYLSTTEQRRLNFLHPPERTPEHFEQLLPYAVALDVEVAWAKQFTDVFKANDLPADYQPKWISSHSGARFSYGHMGTAIGVGLASSVAAASMAPASKGTSGGFGGSGSGGGGGGGGGW